MRVMIDGQEAARRPERRVEADRELVDAVVREVREDAAALGLHGALVLGARQVLERIVGAETPGPPISTQPVSGAAAALSGACARALGASTK
jgi:hypothetical protein